jgi:Tfp pilus assembly protein PilV
MSSLEFSPLPNPNGLGGAPAPSGVGPATGRRSRTFWIMMSLLLLLGLCAAGGGVAGLVAAANRHPSQAQITTAGQRELAVMWQQLSAGQIFPASVSYSSTLGAQTAATLVGIAPQAPCDSAVDAKAAAVLNAAGCVTVLRATYADASQTALATIGIAVMRSPVGAGTALRALGAGGGGGGLLPVSFPGTIASAFTSKARETYTAQSTAGPYVFLYAAGYADGRSTKLSGSPTAFGYLAESVTTDLGNGLANALATTFQAPANPCTNKNIRC